MAALTKWFPPEVKPVRQGWYESKAEKDATWVFFAYWTGNIWYWDKADRSSQCLIQDRHWRGLKAPAK